MGDRMFEVEEDLVCDVCNQQGAYDLYGDYRCPSCLGNEIEKGTATQGDAERFLRDIILGHRGEWDEDAEYLYRDIHGMLTRLGYFE